MFELYSTSMKTQQLEEEDEELFICHIQSITRSEMCALLLTHPRAHTPGAVDSHTHTWSSGHTNSHKPGAVDTYTPGAVDTHLEQRTHTHTHTHTWSSGHTHTWSSGHTHTHTHTHTHLEQWAHTHTHLEQWKHTHTHTHTHTPGAVGSQRCGARGAVGGSVPCSRVSPQSWTFPAGAENPQPQITSPALYPLGHDCPSIITYSYTVLLHIQCGSVKSNAILIKIHKHIKSYSILSEIPLNVRFFSEI